MNRHFLFLTLSFSLVFANLLYSQTAFDALRFSAFEVSGSARNVGVGGALGALGADFSVASTNPAGLGMFRRGEFVVTPTVLLNAAESLLTNDPNPQANSQNRVNFNLSNLGVVIVGRPRNSNWSTSNFVIGYNRIANFHENFSFVGTSDGSIVERFVELANSPFGLDNFESGLAFDVEGIYDLDGNGIFESDYDNVLGALVPKEQEITRRGALDEIVLAWGANYREKLIMGISVGIPIVSFQEDRTYQESDPQDDVPFFEELTFREFLTTTGGGINAKLGIIYRHSQMLRFGLAVHSPTFFALQDSFSTSMEYSFTDAGQFISNQASSPDGLFDYSLRTPWRFIGSVGAIINKMGFVSAEVEWVNYAGNKFNYDDFPEDEEAVNAAIDNELQSVLNIRIGGELAYNKLRVRLGGGLSQSAVVNDNRINPYGALGFGIRGQNSYIDFAYRINSTDAIFIPYLTDTAPEQVVEKSNLKNRVLVTLGFKL